MDTELLDTFVHISKTHSFTKTAEAMYLTQSAVSARIKQLEALIGHPVFIRYKNIHTVSLTRAGMALLPFAEDFINNWALIRKQINNMQETPILNIEVHPLLVNYLFEKILAVYDIERFNLNIKQHNSLDFLEVVCDSRVDLFISLIKPKVSQYDYIVLGLMKIGMLYNHLLEGPFISVNWGNDINKKIINFLSGGNHTIKTDSLDFAINFLLRKGGRCYLPIDMKIKQIKQDCNYPLIDIPVYAVYDKKRKNPAIDTFVDIICP